MDPIGEIGWAVPFAIGIAGEIYLLSSHIGYAIYDYETDKGFRQIEKELNCENKIGWARIQCEQTLKDAYDQCLILKAKARQ